MLAYISAFRERIFNFKAVLESILVPLSNIFYSIRVSELSFSSQERRRRCRRQKRFGAFLTMFVPLVANLSTNLDGSA